MSPDAVRTCNRAAIVVALLVTSTTPAGSPESVSLADVEQHTGVLTSVKALRAKRWSLSMRTDKDELSFTMDRQTLAYELTPRNRQIFARENKTVQIVQDVNQYRRRLLELKEGELDLALVALGQQSTHERVTGRAEEKSQRGAQSRSLEKNRGAFGALSQSQQDFLREEELRRKSYGMPARLKAGQKTMIVAKKTGDDTLMVLVLGQEAAPKDAEQGKESAAAGALRLIEGLITDGKIEAAKFRLEKLIERYPGTKAATKAKALLDNLR